MMANETVVVTREYLPVTLMRAMAADFPESRNEPGLILTKANYFAIKRYVKTASTIPYKNPVFRTDLALTWVSDALLVLPKAIRANAEKWSRIEEDIFKISKDLCFYAYEMNRTGDDILNEIEILLANYMKDPANPAIRNKVMTLAGKLADLLHGLAPYLLKTNNLKQSIHGFYDEISQRLIPEIQKPGTIFDESMFPNKTSNSTLEPLSLKMVQILGCLQDAEVGVANLEFVWESAAQSLDESLKHLNSIQVLDNILVFKIFFTRIMSSWKQVENYALKLQSLLESAKQEWLRENPQ